MNCFVLSGLTRDVGTFEHSFAKVYVASECSWALRRWSFFDFSS